MFASKQGIEERERDDPSRRAMEPIAAQGRERGFLTSRDLLQGLPAEDLSLERVEAFLFDVQEYFARRASRSSYQLSSCMIRRGVLGSVS
jgi:hypothetical protein